MQKHYYLMIDTETAGGLNNPLVYDIGGAIVDRNHHVYETFSFVVYDVYAGMRDIMKTAYYKNKLPQYENELNSGIRKMHRLSTIQKYVWDLIRKYNVTAIIAHNARFDYNALNNTLTTVNGYKSYFFPYGLPIWCTLTMAKQTFGIEKRYLKWCINNNFLTKSGKPKLTAEVLYRYISQDLDFKEEHTGLADVMIEYEIFMNIIKKHKKIRRTYYKTEE